VREVVRSYTYVGIWMSISIAVILFNKVGLWVLLRHCMHLRQHMLLLCASTSPNCKSLSVILLPVTVCVSCSGCWHTVAFHSQLRSPYGTWPSVQQLAA
jgi:hypothetical protein